MCFFTKEKHGHVSRDWDNPPPRTSYYSAYTSNTANRVATMPLFNGPKKIDVREGHQHRYIENGPPRPRSRSRDGRGHGHRRSGEHGRRRSGEGRVIEERRQ
jgi:hypothetical protein